MIAWGKKVSPAFRLKVLDIANDLAIEADWLMACMAFESGRTFRPDIRNAAGSGAVGLIQFMPQTAAALGTSTERLARMSAVEQLDYVRRYFQPMAHRIRWFDDVYMAILWPAAVGKPASHVLFDRADPKYPKRYVQNAGLDLDKDGKITKAEACAKVRKLLDEGLRPENAA